MIWKKQPVGSKLADLQNNKASKDTATQSAAGLMSASDKTKLDGVATGATAVSVVNNLNSDSTASALSAAQGKALNSRIRGNYINGDDDLNNYNNYEYTGMYNIGGTPPANCPDAWTQLLIIASNSGVLQMLLHENFIKIRRRTGSPLAWTAWRNVLTCDTGWVTIQKDGDNSYMRYRQTGNVVTVTAMHKVSSGTISAWSNYILGQIPTGIRPTYELDARASTDRASSNGVVFAVGSNGNVYFRGMYTGASDSSDVLNGIITYTIN